jgi:DNA-binding NtrC family response regulator
MKLLTARVQKSEPGRRGTFIPMQTAAQFLPHPSVSAPRLHPVDSAATAHIVGLNPAWRRLLLQVEMVAPHVQVATFEGEHGAGKQTLSRFLHSRSPLAQSRFQRRDAREWLLTESDPSLLAGFIYLDRVDLLASPGQGLLLSVLKSLQDCPPGRVLLAASSQASLRQMAGQGLLMPDLAFRLTAVCFAVPPLRQRREDIAPLAQALLGQICARYQQRPVSLGPGALSRLLQHTWPGNVRELASVLEAALIAAEDGIIRVEDLQIPSAFDSRAQLHPATSPENLALDKVIQSHIRHVLDLNHGNKLRAARQLRISRSTLYRILANE